jgi:Phage integrase family
VNLGLGLRRASIGQNQILITIPKLRFRYCRGRSAGRADGAGLQSPHTSQQASTGAMAASMNASVFAHACCAFGGRDVARGRYSGGSCARVPDPNRARSGEVLGARWSEFDLAAKVWRVPANRIKAGREHRVPLTSRAMAILEQMAALRDPGDVQNSFVFPGMKQGGPLSCHGLQQAAAPRQG